MKYHLDSMLPIRAFSPRSGRARGFAAGGMTLEGGGDSGMAQWQIDAAGGPPAPASYADQVAMAQSWGVPADQIASVVGTPQSVAANNQAQAQAITQLTGQAPSWAADVGYTPPPPSWLLPSDYVANKYAAPYTQQQITAQVDPSWVRQMNGQTYASVKGPSDLSGGEYLINPTTGKFQLDAKGNPIGVTYPKSTGGLSNITDSPFATLALTMGAPLAAMGGVAALEGMGALGAGTGATETTLGSLGAGGAFTPAEGASFAIAPGAAYTAAGTTGASLLDQIAATQAAEDLAAGAAYPAGSVPAGAGLSGNVYGATGLDAILAEAGLSGLTAADLLKYGIPLTSLASKLLGGSGSAGRAGSARALSPTLASRMSPTYRLTSIGSGTTGAQTSDEFLKPTFLGKGQPVDLIPAMTPQLFNLPGTTQQSMPLEERPTQSFNVGGEVHTPEFYSPGGYASTHVDGDGDGTSDSVPAMLADGEFVIPADVVSGLGNGSNKAGAKVLNQFLSVVREDKQSNDPEDLPPDSKGPLEYLAMATKQVKA